MNNLISDFEVYLIEGFEFHFGGFFDFKDLYALGEAALCHSGILLLALLT